MHRLEDMVWMECEVEYFLSPEHVIEWMMKSIGCAVSVLLECYSRIARR